MSDINPSNYIGANVVVVGYANEPRYPGYDKNGSRGWKQIPVPINEGFKKDGEFVQTGTTWYEVDVSDESLANNPVSKGDKIRVTGKQEVREYKDKDGNSKLGIAIKFAQIEILESANVASDYSDDTPF